LTPGTNPIYSHNSFKNQKKLNMIRLKACHSLTLYFLKQHLLRRTSRVSLITVTHTPPLSPVAINLFLFLSLAHILPPLKCQIFTYSTCFLSLSTSVSFTGALVLPILFSN
jgi:hypothetical protein